MLRQPRLRPDQLAEVGIQNHPTKRVVENSAAHKFTNLRVSQQFLAQLPDKRDLWRLPRFNLAAREFPVSGHLPARPTPRSHDLLPATSEPVSSTSYLARRLPPENRPDHADFSDTRINDAVARLIRGAQALSSARCCRTHSCCAIAAAAATLSERVDPNWGM